MIQAENDNSLLEGTWTSTITGNGWYLKMVVPISTIAGLLIVYSNNLLGISVEQYTGYVVIPQ